MNLFQEKTKREYVFDTSTLIILVEKCGILDPFKTFAQEINLYIPQRVIEEFFAGKNVNKYNKMIQDCFIPVNVILAEELLPYFNFDSTSGEIWVISYALKFPSCYCVIDEAFGRSICKLFSLNVTGAIGIVDEMKKCGLLSLNDLHIIRDKIKSSRFYLSKDLCDELDRICLN